MPLPETLVQYLPNYVQSMRLGSTIPHMATLTITSAGATDSIGSQLVNLIQQTYAANAVNVTVLSTFPGAQSNSILIPAGATWAVIDPPNSNTATLTLKGVGGDTGIGISATLATVLAFAVATPGSFTITSGGAVPSPGVLVRFV